MSRSRTCLGKHPRVGKRQMLKWFPLGCVTSRFLPGCVACLASGGVQQITGAVSCGADFTVRDELISLQQEVECLLQTPVECWRSWAIPGFSARWKPHVKLDILQTLLWLNILLFRRCAFFLTLNVKHTTSGWRLASLAVVTTRSLVERVTDAESRQICLDNDGKHVRYYSCYWTCSKSRLNPEVNEKMEAQVQLSFLQ